MGLCNEDRRFISNHWKEVWYLSIYNSLHSQPEGTWKIWIIVIDIRICNFEMIIPSLSRKRVVQWSSDSAYMLVCGNQGRGSSVCNKVTGVVRMRVVRRRRPNFRGDYVCLFSASGYIGKWIRKMGFVVVAYTKVCTVGVLGLHKRNGVDPRSVSWRVAPMGQPSARRRRSYKRSTGRICWCTFACKLWSCLCCHSYNLRDLQQCSHRLCSRV